MAADADRSHLGITKSSTLHLTHPLRKYALAIEGSNSIALFASATASAHKVYRLITSLGKYTSIAHKNDNNDTQKKTCAKYFKI